MAVILTAVLVLYSRLGLLPARRSKWKIPDLSVRYLAVMRDPRRRPAASNGRPPLSAINSIFCLKFVARLIPLKHYLGTVYKSNSQQCRRSGGSRRFSYRLEFAYRCPVPFPSTFHFCLFCLRLLLTGTHSTTTEHPPQSSLASISASVSDSVPVPVHPSRLSIALLTFIFSP
jgi:hypothetical protein